MPSFASTYNTEVVHIMVIKEGALSIHLKLCGVTDVYHGQ